MLAELAAALGTRNRVEPVENELAADETLQASAAQERVQLLLQRAVERPDGHSERKTPVTLPRIWTWSA